MAPPRARGEAQAKRKRGQPKADEATPSRRPPRSHSSSSSARRSHGGRAVRFKRAIERYTGADIVRAPAKKGVEIVEGPGTKLKDIPKVHSNLRGREVDENLHLLHTILFGKSAKATTLKRNIYRFSGFVWGENQAMQKEKVKKKINKCLKKNLIDFCQLLEIPVTRSTRKESLVEELISFLESPQANEGDLPSRGGRGSQATREDVPSRRQGGGKRKRATREDSEAEQKAGRRATQNLKTKNW